MSSFRNALLMTAKARNEKRKNDGFIGTISPAPNNVIDEVLHNIRDRVSHVDVVVDLGCGDGRWCTAIAQRFDAYCIGVEMDPERLDLCRKREMQLKTSPTSTATSKMKVDWVRADFSSQFNLSIATVVIFYLSREGNEVVRIKAERECYEGTLLVAIGFQVTSWNPEHSFTTSNKMPIYLYTFGNHKNQ